ncbi:hypothetical protein L3i22_024050 [Actinoplanes sp. L3-i22]|nr:hypothetical protein L3i22_024050 [Actinoplanes sp. L3-i22]
MVRHVWRGVLTPQPFATREEERPQPDPHGSRPVLTAAAPQNSCGAPRMHTTLTVLSDLAVAAAVQPLAAPKTLPQVIDGITGWIMGIIALVATMYLVIGGLRYMAAGGDPAQVEQAKGNFKSALIGYALAVLAPVVLKVLQGILGG